MILFNIFYINESFPRFDIAKKIGQRSFSSTKTCSKTDNFFRSKEATLSKIMQINE